MKATIKLLLILSIFVTFASAGDQGTGGYHPCDPQTETCPPPPPPDCTEDCGEGSSMASIGGSDDTFSFGAVADAIEASAFSSFTAGH